ncbi:hypothetical protein NPN19_04260 [Vibrio parahaemolyticus]|nr:hypothetical protein [Vibrio parahaemolyticus]MBM5140661.1 hypothetical protein [Vibrio parahaemolyticus]MCQ6479056.1 hypothetical protein [Vibrio parahaemolyticus]HCE2508280.1 hypothetical protein [Vibrio parahaemolyticus]HCG5145319.1 hypothetical protein [Vibrio parahaemolyticus]
MMLSAKMRENAKIAADIEGLTFKYSLFWDFVFSKGKPPKTHRVMCKGELTENKWIWLGDSSGPFLFDSPEQAISFIKEIIFHKGNKQ